MLSFIDHLQPSSLRTIQIGDKVLTFSKFLHRGSGGLTSLFIDNEQNEYVLKTTLGEDASFEAKMNERLGRLLYYYKNDENWDHILFSYIDGIDIDKALSPYLATPAIDYLGCAIFEAAYLDNPFLGFANGLERNLAIAVELIKEQEELYKNHIIHNDVQLANYILTETKGNISVSGIDFGAATDLAQVNNSDEVLQENIDSLQEALKALLPQKNYLRMMESLSEKDPVYYSDMIAALQKQMTVKAKTESMVFPSFIHALQNREQAIESDLSSPKVTENPRHIAFIESRLERSIRLNNTKEAISYILHGGKLTERMVNQLKSNPGSDLTKLLDPYIQEHELQKLEAGIKDLNLTKLQRK